MKLDFLALAAFSPILVALTLVYIRRLPIKYSMPIACVFTSFIAILIWNMPLNAVAASIVQGLVLSIEIIFILFAALFLMHTLRESRVMAFIRGGFEKISPDRRIQAILVSWFLGAGVDSLFGFGPTAGTSAAILGGLGFPPACALIIAVMGTVTSSAFCAIGTPISIGIAAGLEPAHLASQLQVFNLDFPSFLKIITAQTAIFHGIAGTFMPLFMIIMMKPFCAKKQSWMEILSIAPFAFFCGLAFTIPYVLTAIFLGPEFPSLIGAIIGSALAITAIKLNFLIPRGVWDFPPKEQWGSDWSAGKSRYPYSPETPDPMSPWKAWMPYLILAGLLIIARLPQWPIASFLESLSLRWKNLFGSSIDVSLNLFYFPGVILLIVTGISIFLYRPNASRLREAFGGWTLAITWITLLNIPFTISMACIYKNSYFNSASLPSMPEIHAQWIAQLPGSQFWSPFLSPFIAATGSFFVSNNTFSNIFFASMQNELGRNLLMPNALFLSLQAVGSSIGNMISLHYLAGAGAVVGMLGWSAPLGRKTIYPLFAYLIIVGILGLIAAHFPYSLNFLFPQPVQF